MTSRARFLGGTVFVAAERGYLRAACAKYTKQPAEPLNEVRLVARF